MYGVFHDGVFYALRGLSKSKRDNLLSGSVMIVMKESLSLGSTRIFMEKQSELIPKPLIQIQKLFVFDHYSSIPLFHVVSTKQTGIKLIAISISYRISETFQLFKAMPFHNIFHRSIPNNHPEAGVEVPYFLLAIPVFPKYQVQPSLLNRRFHELQGGLPFRD